MQYIAIKDNKIVKVFRTKSGLEDVKKSCEFLKLNYDKIELVPTGAKTHSKMDVGEFKKGWKLKTLEERVNQGFRFLPPHLKVRGDIVTEKTLKEKIDDGVIKLKAYQVYDAVEKCIKVDETKRPKPAEPTQAELKAELQALINRAKEVESKLIEK